jgi:hypothetical protein
VDGRSLPAAGQGHLGDGAARTAVRGDVMRVVYTRGTYKDVCKHGHPLSGENVRVKANGQRECWACRRIQRRRHNRGGAP